MMILLAILLLLSCLAWLGLLANALTIHSSDPAGRGLAVAYGVMNAGLLLVTMAALLTAAAIAGRLPTALLLGFVPLVPVACAACVSTLALIGKHGRMRWMAVVVIAAPGLLHGVLAARIWTHRAGDGVHPAQVWMLASAAACCVPPFAAHWLARKQRSKRPINGGRRQRGVKTEMPS